ncbi:MAG TPA: hypothetical protein VMU75_15930 [Acidimicrobiales bacterium]|nr:hypothetical protein [Acidimicrobiales bacterium]
MLELAPGRTTRADRRLGCFLLFAWMPVVSSMDSATAFSDGAR